MRLRVALDVSIGPDGYGGFTVSDWSRNAADKLRRRLERIDNENAALTEKRKLLEEQGPALWQMVCEQVKKLCDDLNADYQEKVAVVQESSAHALHVELRHAGSMSELNASFNISTGADALKWSFLPPRPAQGTYALQINAGRVAFQNSMTPSTPESIARQMLDGLLQY
jgi:hypothetical protein